MPARLSVVNGASMFLAAPEDMLPILVVARFGDGADLDVTESSRLTYVVADTQVASVSATGLVTARRAGQTTVTIRYRLGTQTLQTQITATVGRRQ